MSRTAVTPAARDLIDRVAVLLSGRSLREVRMFGAVAVMLDDAMAVAVQKDGSLLVRVDPAEDARLIQHPHASRPVMGTRSMGPGWISVDAAGLRDDEQLGEWVACASRYLAFRDLLERDPGSRADQR